MPVNSLKRDIPWNVSGWNDKQILHFVHQEDIRFAIAMTASF